MSSDDFIQELADRQAITDMIYRYCRSVDRLDVPLGHSIWHEDSTADYGPGLYQGDGRGVIDHICAQHAHLLHHSHQVSNILLEIRGDSAGSESYVTASLRMQAEDGIKQLSVWARYVDQWSRRDGRWGLDKRITVIDFDEIRDVTPMGEHTVARRDRDDPSYGVLSRPGN